MGVIGIVFSLVYVSLKEFGVVGSDTYTWGLKDFHKCWSGSLAKRRLCLGPAGVVNCTPLSALSFWVSLFPGMRGYKNGSGVSSTLLYLSDIPDTSRFSCYRKTTLNNMNVLHYLGACSVLNHFTFIPLVLLETYWWWLSWFREDRWINPKDQHPSPELHWEWVLVPWFISKSLWPQI